MSNLVPYLGGKNRLAKTVIAKLPAHTCYCEVFAGGAGVFFAKEPAESEILNDRDRELVNLYRIVKLHPEELHRQFKFSLVSRAEFERLMSENPESLTDVQRAARYLYVQQSCYGGRVNNRTWSANTAGPGNLSLFNLQSVIEEAWMRLAGTQVACETLEGAAVCADCAPAFRRALDDARGGDAWGRARDAHVVARALLRERGGTTQLLLRDLPAPVVKAFKTRAATEGVTVRELFLVMVEGYLQKAK